MEGFPAHFGLRFLMQIEVAEDQNREYGFKTMGPTYRNKMHSTWGLAGLDLQGNLQNE